MPRFEFIESPQFRASLEADYAEMERCFDNGAWKSVQVLGGSIVEALLIDYLVATKSTRTGKDPLKMDLADAVAICRTEKVLSDRTADLCSVVRSYRNLIHPGRVVRLGEDLPSESSARIAVALIELICDEVARVRQSEFGLTGEQIVSKVERDANSLAILKHLLEDVSTNQKERILLDLLPKRYFELKILDQGLFSDHDYFGVILNLRRAFRLILDNSPEPIKTKVAQQFITILREAEGDRVVAYAVAFFEPSDLAFVPETQRSIVKEFLFSQIGSTLHPKDFGFVEGLEKFLTAADVNRWVDPIIRAIVSSSFTQSDRDTVRDYFVETGYLTPVPLEAPIATRLEAWVKHFRGQGRESDAETLSSLLTDWQAAILPF